MNQRIAKFLSAAGVCSRREGEALIATGRIKLNDQVVTTPTTFVRESDVVTFDNRTVRLTCVRQLWAFYKPVECITSRVDPEGRKTIYDILPPSFKNIRYVGRLDYFSEGLLLLTNDGALVRSLELPRNKIPRIYRVRIYGAVQPNFQQLLLNGITVDDIEYKGIQVEVEPAEGRNTWLRLTLVEGKNREIRRIMNYLGYKLNRLVRVGYGPVTIDGLKLGQVKEIPIEVIDKYLQR
ncbi:MAG: rRNA pseudouridine synthase [Candidatus Paracaedibacteraceae bacterium]|nr:rRNA pseudouridine synthase [Candidatus Paracaedibacteraceae bacterium]